MGRQDYIVATCAIVIVVGLVINVGVLYEIRQSSQQIESAINWMRASGETYNDNCTRILESGERLQAAIVDRNDAAQTCKNELKLLREDLNVLQQDTTKLIFIHKEVLKKIKGY